MILRLLNGQGMAGAAGCLLLLGLLVAQHVDALHWRRESSRFEKLYTDEHSAFASTAAAYRAAADRARADDRDNIARVTAEQRTINQGTENDFKARLAAARLAADRLRSASASRAADPRSGGGTPVPGLPTPARGVAEAPIEDRLPAADALTATEQAIQLDELIKWVNRQAAVDPNTAQEQSAD